MESRPHGGFQGATGEENGEFKDKIIMKITSCQEVYYISLIFYFQLFLFCMKIMLYTHLLSVYIVINKVGKPRTKEKKMEATIRTYIDESKLILTTMSPASHYGIPAVRHEDCSQCRSDFSPGDAVPQCLESQQVIAYFGATENMAEYVKDAVSIPDLRDENLREGLRKWLAQLPDGPQVVDHTTGGENGGPFWEIK